MPTRIGASLETPGVEWAEDRDGEKFPNVCPGWAVRQPVVVEACQAYQAFSKQAFDSMYPDPSQALCEGVIELSRAFDEYTRQQTAAANERSKRV